MPFAADQLVLQNRGFTVLSISKNSKKIKGWAQNRGLFDRKFNIVRIRLFWRFQCITSGIYMILLYSNRNLVMHFQ